MTGWRIDIKSETQVAEEAAYAEVDWAEGEWVVDEETGEQVWKPAEGGPEVSLDQWNEASTLDEEVMDQENIEPDSTSTSEEESLEEDTILEDSETSAAETEEELEESEESS